MTDRHVEGAHLEAHLIRARGPEEGPRIFRSLTTGTQRQHYAAKRLNDLHAILQSEVAPYLPEWLDKEDVDSPEGKFQSAMQSIRQLAGEAVHHLHSASDPLAAAIYWFSVRRCNRTIRDRDLSLYKVWKSTDVDQRYRGLLKEIYEGDAYEYLAVLSNRAKHVSIVKEQLPMRPEETSTLTAQKAIRFEAFDWPRRRLTRHAGPINQRFPATPIVPFLEAEMQRFAALFNQLVYLVRDDLDVELAKAA